MGDSEIEMKSVSDEMWMDVDGGREMGADGRFLLLLAMQGKVQLPGGLSDLASTDPCNESPTTFLAKVVSFLPKLCLQYARLHSSRFRDRITVFG